MKINFKNNDCPLSRTEKNKIKKIMDEKSWIFYYPYKHRSSSFYDWCVYHYDEKTIKCEIMVGITEEEWETRSSYHIDRIKL